MRRYIIRRVLQAVVMLFIMSIALFALLHAIPGGPEAVLFNPRMDAQTKAILRHNYGLDQPLPVQYLSWLGNLLHGNFGNSFSSGQPVTAEMGARLPNTLELFFAAFAVALTVAIFLGVISAVRQYSITDYSATILSYFGISMPIFWFALILQVIFAVKLGLLPPCCISANDTSGFTLLDNFEDRLVHLDLAHHRALPRLYRRLEPLSALQHARHGQARLHPHGAREGRKLT